MNIRCWNAAKKGSAGTRPSNEDGNILLLGLGIGCVALLTLLGMVQVGSWYLAKKELSNLADTAALIYADQAAANSYYAKIEQTLGLQGPERTSPEQAAIDFLIGGATQQGQELGISFRADGANTEVVVERPTSARLLVSLGDVFHREFIVSVSAKAISVNPG